MEPKPVDELKGKAPATNADAPGPPSQPWAPAAPSEKPTRQRHWLVGVVVLILVFLTGFLPMWLKAGRLAVERDTARREAKLLQLETFAAAAAIDARRGEYEPARQAASRFFTALGAELDLGPDSVLNPSQQNALKPLLLRRDDLITLLARNDPAAAERLTDLYLACRKSLRGG